MERLFKDISDLLSVDDTRQDECDGLRSVSILLESLGPSIVLLADKFGTLIAWDGDASNRAEAAALALELSFHLSESESCRFERRTAAGPCCAFGWRLPADAEGGIVGGLLRPSTKLDVPLGHLAGPLVVCGTLAWSLLQRRARELPVAGAQSAGPRRTRHAEGFAGRGDRGGHRRARRADSRRAGLCRIPRTRGRTALQRLGAGQGGRRGRQPGQERIPGQHEPRDSHAHDGHPGLRRIARSRRPRRPTPNCGWTRSAPSAATASTCWKSSTTSSISRRSKPAGSTSNASVVRRCRSSRTSAA